ncbi:MAG: response regulator [Desulfovibrionales bacterium]
MAGKCIVVIDDDQGILDAFDAILGDEFTIHYERDGVSAKRAILENAPSLLFLDIKMPGMNGIDVLRWIRQRNLDTKVVLITALPQSIYETMATQYGAHFVRKPFEVQDIESLALEAVH